MAAISNIKLIGRDGNAAPIVLGVMVQEVDLSDKLSREAQHSGFVAVSWEDASGKEHIYRASLPKELKYGRMFAYPSPDQNLLFVGHQNEKYEPVNLILSPDGAIKTRLTAPARLSRNVHAVSNSTELNPVMSFHWVNNTKLMGVDFQIGHSDYHEQRYIILSTLEFETTEFEVQGW